jgi:hypothetical protein
MLNDVTTDTATHSFCAAFERSFTNTRDNVQSSNEVHTNSKKNNPLDL